DGKRLRVFPEDSDLPKDAANGRIDESFVSRAVLSPPPPEEFDRWKGDLLAQLRAASFRTFPDRVPAARVLNTQGQRSSTHWLETEPGIEVVMDDRRPAGRPTAEATLFILDEDGQTAEPWKEISGPLVVL